MLNLTLSLLILTGLLACDPAEPPPSREAPPVAAPPAPPAPPPPPAPEPPVDAPAPGAERPEMTVEACEAQGTVVGDIGDGAVHRPDYRCPDGRPPIGRVASGIEGAVCCAR